MEELFTRNQQMKEQHRLLTENIKVLENRYQCYILFFFLIITVTRNIRTFALFYNF